MKSVNILAVTAFGALFLYFVVVRINRYIQEARFIKAHGCKEPPRVPQSERIIGYDLFKKRRENYKAKTSFKNDVEKFGVMGPTYSGVIFGSKFIKTADPENVKAILSTNFKDFGLGRRKVTLSPLLGDGIFTSDGLQWEHSRALIRPAFAKSQVSQLDGFETHVRYLMEQIPSDGSTFDLQKLFFKLTLDTSTGYLFGESVDSLRASDGSEQQKFSAAFDAAQIDLISKDQFGPLAIFYNSKSLNANCKTVHQYVDKFVYQCLEYRKQLDEKEDDEKEDDEESEERYVFLNELAKATQDPKQLRDELLNMLLAGRDTTAGLLAHLWFWMARRPDIWQKLKAEVDQLNGVVPDYDTLRNMKYLRYLLNESLRLHPALPGNARFANKNTTIPRGGGPDGTSPIFVPKGMPIVYSPYAMHRNKAVFGEDADEFNPDRWETLRVGWEYLPFNGGPRICVGQQFALTEAGYTTVRLVQNFEVESRDLGEYEEAYSFTNLVGNGVKVSMTPRK